MAKITSIGYFPFCLKPGVPSQTGKGTDYPINLPLKKFMSWYWKVKTWETTGFYATSNESAGNTLAVATWLKNNDDDQWTEPTYYTSEKSLVCPIGIRPIRASFRINYKFYNGGSLQQDYDTDIPLYVNFDLFGDNYISGNTVYPKMRVFGWFDSLFPGNPKVQAQVDPFSVFKIDGVTIPCYIYWFPSSTGASDWSWSGNQNFDLKPKTYWPYS